MSEDPDLLFDAPAGRASFQVTQLLPVYAKEIDEDLEHRSNRSYRRAMGSQLQFKSELVLPRGFSINLAAYTAVDKAGDDVETAD